MITYNNDVLSEIWDAKRLIREYVNVAHLISHFYENSDLSFSNMSCGQTGEEYATQKVKVSQITNNGC